MNDYASRRSAADLYLPAQIAILSDVLLVPSTEIMIAPDDIDRAEGVDVLCNGYRVSLRVRSASALRFSDQFTIRLTELPKIGAGLVDAMLYGFASATGLGLERWTLIDLAPLRASILNNYECVNVDCQDDFLAFPLNGFPLPIILASSAPLPQPDALACECRRRVALGVARKAASRPVGERASKRPPDVGAFAADVLN